MAAYRWVYGFGHLWADGRGSARFKYGTIFNLITHRRPHTSYKTRHYYSMTATGRYGSISFHMVDYYFARLGRVRRFSFSFFSRMAMLNIAFSL